MLITTSEDLGRKVIEHIETILTDMPTRDYAAPAWRDWGAVHVVETLGDAYALADEYAYEHVQILTRNPREALEKMHDYGALRPRLRSRTLRRPRTLRRRPRRQIPRHHPALVRPHLQQLRGH